MLEEMPIKKDLEEALKKTLRARYSSILCEGDRKGSPNGNREC